MDETQDNATYAVHLRAEHHRLHEAIQRINHEWPTTIEQMQLPGGMNDTVASLSQLRKELESHFHEEEEGGCLEEAACRCPSLGHDAQTIRDEHAPLLAELDTIISGLTAGGQSLQAIDELHRSFGRLAHELHAHESAENRLLEMAFGVPVD